MEILVEQVRIPYAFTILLIFAFGLLLIRIFSEHCLKAKILRVKLQKQGIGGPKPTSIIFGNIPEIKKIKAVIPGNNSNEPPSVVDCSSIAFPHIKQWTKQYGKTFTFALGRVQILHVADPDLVREFHLCKSLDLGKPAYLQKDRGPLLGKGLITANREMWSHERKTIAPTLYVDKVKNMVELVLESGNSLVKSWASLVESEGGTADIRVDEYVRKFTCHIFSSIMFGSNYPTGAGLFQKCRALLKASGSPTILDGLPFYRFLPNKTNREQWRLEKEIYSIIMDTAKQTNRASGENMIQILMEGTNKGNIGSSTPEQFVVDNCKDLYLAAFEVTGVAAIWGLMLLAAHPEWQARARAEILEVCGNKTPDAEILSKMKVLKMVIQEMLRLYPGVAFISREALQDVKIGKLIVPKGVNIFLWMLDLHRDPQLWGPDADKFNPERFANGISGACKSPGAYVPFGVGPRICPGQSLAMLELRVMFALILVNFSFTLSPNYCHVPHYGLLLEPKHGVNLLVRKI